MLTPEMFEILKMFAAGIYFNVRNLVELYGAFILVEIQKALGMIN